MRTVNKITQERLSLLATGTALKMGSQIILFNGVRNGIDSHNRPTQFVDYIDQKGEPRTFDIQIVLSCTTESLSAEPCAWCGKFRMPEDITKSTIHFYKRQERMVFCREGGCAASYQGSVKLPSKTFGHSNRKFKVGA